MSASVFARFPQRLREAIVGRLGWTSLRPVQELSGAALLDGNNAVVLAPTAGGKTEAAMFPTLAQLVDRPVESVGALYLAPIKALLNNQEERLGTYTEMVGLQRFVWHGDASESAKRKFVKEPAELLMTTPESLEVMLLSSRVPVPKLFADLRIVIIDEVHAFSGTDRGAHLASVLERLVRFTDNDVQRVGLSATVGNPRDILRWMQGTSTRPGVVVDPPKPPPRRDLSVSLYDSLIELSAAASAQSLGKKSLFFCQSRATTESVGERMRGQGTDVFVHHSSVSLEQRRAAEERFASGTNACIVCTSTLELGIDVGDLDRVFQAEAPSSVSSFLQRMGRTGRRAGSVANTSFFCEEPASVLQAIALIELANEGWVEDVPVLSRCWPVMVHQLFALTLQFGAISAERCWAQLSRVPDLSGITRDEFDALVAHMKREDFLFEAGGLLSMGQKAEKMFGKKNFLELYAVFSSPQLYRVESPSGADIGSLEQAFVDTLVEDMTSFLLGGRAWTVKHVNHSDRVVRVEPAPRGRKPAWGGFLPQMLSFALCQRIRAVLASDADYAYLDEISRVRLKDTRDSLGALLQRKGVALESSDNAVRLWTFAGGRINHTLKYAFELCAGWKVVADNMALRIEGASATDIAVTDQLASWANTQFWTDPTSMPRVLTRVPPYRLSKFQPVMPEAIAAEMIGDYLLDWAGTAAFLSSAEGKIVTRSSR